MIKRTILILISIIMAAYTVLAQAPEIGKPAPNILISEWLNKTPNVLPPFIGKTVILEFWATWCGPCVKMIPHINSLVDKFASDSVMFVSITQENKEKVTGFLEKKTMKAFIALDSEGKTNSAYGIRFIPRAFIIDPAGNIAWQGHPVDLNETFLGEYIKTKKLPSPKQEVNEGLSISNSDDNNTGISFSFGPNEIHCNNVKLPELFEILLNKTKSRFNFQGTIPLEPLNISYYSKENKDRPALILEMYNKILEHYSVKTQVKTEKRKGWIITCRNCKTLEEISKNYTGSQNYSSSINETESVWTGKCINMLLFTIYLERNFSKLIIDETGLNGYFDFEYNKTGFDKAMKDLEKYGLKFTESNRNIEITYFIFPE